MSPVVGDEEARRRGQTALEFYHELRAEPGDDFELVSLPAVSAASANGGVLGRLQRVLHSVFAP